MKRIFDESILKPFYTAFFITLFFAINTVGYSQTNIYSENFSSNNGKGYDGTAGLDVAGVTNWSITTASQAITGSEYFKVNSSRFEAKGAFGQTDYSGTPAYWNANQGNAIDISSYGRVSISVLLGNASAFQATLMAQVSFDGTNWMDLGILTGATVNSSTVSVSNIVGDNLYFRVAFWVNSSSTNGLAYIDDVLITGYTGYTKTVISATGSGTFSVPAGVGAISVYGYGGGGGGGSTSILTKGGSGGGGGAFASTTIGVSEGSTCYYYVGQGGTGGVYNATQAATNGEDTWFNKSTSSAPSSSTDGILAKGGGLGGSSNGGGGGAIGSGGAASSSVGSSTVSGADGGSWGNYAGGSGGISASMVGIKRVNSNLSGSAGSGASDVNTTGPTGGFYAGSGGLGRGDNSNTPGGDGTQPGGGGGGCDDLTASGNNGGAGGAGKLIISYATCIYAARTYTVGPSGDFSSLTSAISNLKNCGFAGNITLALQDTYNSNVETFPITIDGSLGTGASKTITIRPETTSAVSITGSNSGGSIISIDGASYITIDGRPSGQSTSYLTISNTAAAAASNRAISISNNASNNTIQYCTVKADNSSTTATTAGVIHIGAGASGNNTININNCTLTYATASTACLIVSNNTTGTNTPCSISTNTLKDFTNYGVWANTGSSAFTIQANQVYQTAGAYTTSTSGTYLIYLGAGTSHDVNGNYLGGAGTNCNSADYFTVNANGAIYGVYVGPITGAGTNYVRNNTIKYLKSANTGGNGVVTGIYLNDPTSTNLYITGNTIAYLNSSSSNTSSTHYSVGMQSSGTASSLVLHVNKNKITNLENGVTNSSALYYYGIDFSSTTATTSAYYYNNYLNFGASTCRAYGISTGGASRIINNTIYVTSTDANTYIKYNLSVVGGVTNVIKNNLFINAASASANTYNNNVVISTAGAQTHNNNFYQFHSSGSSAKAGGSATDWTTENGGVNAATAGTVSLDANGAVTSPSSTNVWNSGEDLSADATLAITEDINGNPRNNFNHSIGCHEYTCVTNYNGTYQIGTGPGATWATLTAALADLRSCMNGTVILELQGHDGYYTDASETYPISLANLPTNASTTLTIRPDAQTASAITFDGTDGGTATDAGLFSFNGTDYVTIDGRPGGNVASTSKFITIENTNTAGGSAIKLYNDAKNNTIEFCTIKSNYTSTSVGVITFGAATTDGNDDNTITKCIIDGTKAAVSPTNGVAEIGIYSAGTASKLTSGNTVSYCEFKDIFIANAATYFINLDANNDAWNISYNSFYQTGTCTTTGAATPVYGIYAVGGDNHTISNNYIGGSAANSSGTWTHTQTSTNYAVFYGIYLTVGTTTATNIQGNTFAGFNWSFYGSGSEIWNPIKVTAGKVEIGTTTANTIGASSGTGSITFSHGNIAAAPVITGIDVASTSTVNIKYNVFGSITFGNSNNQYYAFTGIKTTSSGAFDVSYNVIGGSTTNSIQSDGANTGGYFIGIQNNSTAASTVSYNSFGNITLTFGYFIGIDENGVAGGTLHTVSNNTIGTNAITNSSTSTSNNSGIRMNNTGTNYAVTSNTIKNISVTGNAATLLNGILCTSTGTYTIKNNYINALSCSGGANNSVVSGIQYSGDNASSTVHKNAIVGLTNTQTGASAAIHGIYLSSSLGTNLVYNNYIEISANGTNVNMYGISAGAAGTPYVTMYYNTVNISGTPSSGAANSSCFYYPSTASIHLVACKNNIFQNTRLNGGTATGSHYCYYLGSTTTCVNALNVVDYNYYHAATDASFAYVAAAKTGTGTYQAAGTFNSDARGFGGQHSIYTSGAVTIGSYGSLSSSALTTVTRGTDLHATTNCTDDINSVVGERDGAGGRSGCGYRGCYEGSGAYYWVGGSGNWNDITNHWSSTSGGTPNMSTAPSSSDNVYFDSNSGGGTCTLDGAANSNSFTASANTALTGAYTLSIYGTLNNSATFTSGTTTIAMTGTSWGITNSGSLTFHHLTIAGTPSVQPSSSYTVDGTLTVSSGKTFAPTGGTITMSGASGSIVNSTATDITFYDLIVSGTVSSSGNFNITTGRTMTVSGTFTPAAADVINNASAVGTLTGTGTVKVTRIAATADFSSQYKFATNTLADLTVEYCGGGAQTCSGLTYGGLKINNASNVTMGGDVTVNGLLNLAAGTLSIGAHTLTIASSTANQPIRTTGNVDATNASATIAFINSTEITLPSSFFSGNVNNFTMNCAGGVILSSATTVAGTLTITQGIIDLATNSVTLTLGTGTGTTGTLAFTPDASYEQNKGIYTDNTGYFRRWIASTTGVDIIYPLMGESDYRGATLNYTSAPTGGTLSLQYILGNPGTNGVTIASSPVEEVDGGGGQDIDEVSRDGYWKMTAGTISGGTYNLIVEPKYHMGVQQYTKLTIVNRANSTSNWATFGTRINPTGNSIYDPIIERRGYTSYFEFCLGSRILDNLLSNMAHISGSAGGTIDGYYTSLTNAGGVFQTLNGTNQSGQNVVVTILNSYESEKGDYTLTGAGGMWTTLKIYPTETGFLLSGSQNKTLFKIEGADNVTIDGRVLQAGSADLILQNTSTGNSASTIELISGATNNVVKYCSLRGSSANSAQGILMISTDASGSGNDNNTISYNTFKKSSEGTIPANGIYSSGTTGRENTTIMVNSNNFEDFSVAGINLNAYSDAWSIVSNSFYQSASQTPANTMYFIKANITAGACSGNTIQSNYFGGQAASGGSSTNKFTLASSANPFYGIYMNMLTGSTSTISSNYFQNINITSTSSSGVSMIYTTGAGSFTIGSSGNGNTIGSTSGTNSITTSLSNATVPSFNGIFSDATGTISIAYNTIGDIALTNATANGGVFNGIKSTAATISNNTIGNSNSGNISLATTNTTSNNSGILLSGTGTYTCNSNIVQNMSASGAGAVLLYGINLLSTGTYNLSGNIIRTLKYTGTTAVAAKVHGIHGTAAPTASVIEKNRISGIENGSSATTSELVGIYTTTGNYTHRNNLIIISNNSGTYTYNIILRGIYVITTTATNVYNNTIWLSGSDNTAAGTSPQYGSACLDVAAGSGVNVKNNIFKNTRTTTNNKHVTCRVDSYTGKTVDKNYGEAPVAAKYALVGTTDKTAATWVTAGATNEVDGTAFNITINSDGSVSTSDLANVTVGSDGLGFTDDINGTARTAPPDGYFRGCYEGAPLAFYWVGGSGNWSDYTNHWSYTSGGVPAVPSAPTTSTNVYFDANSTGTCTINAAATAKNITCTGYTGTITGTQTIDVYGSVVFVAGMTYSNTGIVSLRATSGTNTFTSAGKTLGGLTINGAGGTFTLQDNMTLSGNFLSTAGTFDLNGYNISLGGSWTKNGGTFTPGTKKVTFTGTGNIDGSETTTFYDLDVNSSGTITLGHDEDITNNLTITAGTLAAGSYTATVTGTTTVAGTLSISTGTADCNGTFNATGGNITFTGAGNLKLGGGTVTSLGTLTSSAGTVWYDRADVQSVLADDYYHLKIDGGAGTKTAQGAVNVNGDFTLNTGATYALAATTTTVTGSTDLNSTVTISTGTFDANGNFDATDGTITFTGAGNLKLGGGTITSLGTLTSSAGTVWYDRAGAQSVLNVPYFNLKIDGSGTKTQADALTINGDLTIAAGTLDAGSDYAIGIAGNWTNSGGTYTARNGTVTFNGAAQQNILTNNNNYYSVTLTNSNGYLLQDNMTVGNTLTMTSGNIDAGSNTLQLGTGTGNLGTLSYTAGSIIGNFKRWFAGATVNNVQFPVGTAATMQLANISYTTAPTGDYLIAKYTAGNPGTNGVDLSTSTINDNGFTINKIFTTGYWTFTAGAGLADGVYSIDLTANNFAGVSDYRELHLLKRVNSSSNWAVLGTHSAGTGSNSSSVIHRTGLTGFCDACVGGNSGVELPVEMLKFVAECQNDKVELIWETASEQNSDYFVVERSTDLETWIPLGTKSAAGNSNTLRKYSYNDIDIESGLTYYYRLLQVDINGEYEYFGPVQSKCSVGSELSLISVNSVGEKLEIVYSSPHDGEEILFIMQDIRGEKLFEKRVFANEGINTLRIDDVDLIVGVYILSMDNGITLLSRKFVVRE